MLQNCESSSRSRGSQKSKTTITAVTDDAKNEAKPQSDLAAVLKEI